LRVALRYFTETSTKDGMMRATEKRVRRFVGLLQKTGNAWMDHNAQEMGAALAYYTVLSMAPLLVLSVVIASLVYGEKAAEGGLASEIQGIVGSAAAVVIQDVIKNAHRPASGIIATIAGLIILLFSASAVFTQLRTSLDRIWDVPVATLGGIKGMLRLYLFAFMAALTLGFLLLISLVMSAVLEIFEGWIGNIMPSLPLIAKSVNFVVSFGTVAVLFALIYKYVPNVKVNWSEVVFGAISTALLFMLGKFVLAVYIAKMGVGNAYGAAGSLVVLLFWVYYSAQIFLFGAEFTHIYAAEKRPIHKPAMGSGLPDVGRVSAV
jgi:membrane protein